MIKYGGPVMAIDEKVVSEIIYALGGLGLFLYGMKLLGNGLNIVAVGQPPDFRIKADIPDN